jgi:hypothetical protein
MNDITIIVELVPDPITVVSSAEQGPPGTSPYQIAVQNGYEGTELEYSMLVIVAAAASADQTELCRLATLAATTITAAAQAVVNAGLLIIPVTSTASSFTVTPAIYNGGALRRNTATLSTTTLPTDAPIGANCVIRQVGAGQTQFVSNGPVAVGNASGLTKTRAMLSAVTAVVETNPDGVSAGWIIDGDLT